LTGCKSAHHEENLYNFSREKAVGFQDELSGKVAIGNIFVEKFKNNT